MRYNSTVPSIRNANRIRGSMLRIGQVLSVPLRGPCTRCPIPPPVVVPPRRLPGDAIMQAKAEVAAPAEPSQVQAVPALKTEGIAGPGLKAEAPPEVKAAVEEKQVPQATASDVPGT
jgi:hypothetical protein